jgi:hypothetical protein
MPRRTGALALLLSLLALGLSACIPPPPPQPRTITYSVAVDGAVVSSVDELASLAGRVLTDPHGWAAAGIQFVRVADGGDFTLVLANPERVATYDPVCDTVYSCSVGRWVVINDTRFALGSSAWPGDLEAYRVMVINHEVGHFLGLGHAYCSAPGASAPVMQQQSISMQGCAVNAWPLPWELDQVR